jgi:hypothetical protein
MKAVIELLSPSGSTAPGSRDDEHLLIVAISFHMVLFRRRPRGRIERSRIAGPEFMRKELLRNFDHQTGEQRWLNVLDCALV